MTLLSIRLGKNDSDLIERLRLELLGNPKKKKSSIFKNLARRGLNG